MKILFVSTGSTGRSPMAEAYVRHCLEVRGISDVGVASAGIRAGDGAPASAGATAVLREIGVDLSRFRSTQLKAPMLYAADRIVCMSRSHREVVLQIAPDCAEKIELLLGDQDVPDPSGESAEGYRRVFAVMRPRLDAWADRLAKVERPEKTKCFALPGGLAIAALSVIVGMTRFVIFPFPKRDPLTYLAIVQYWIETGSYAAVVDKYPKFGLLPFAFLPVKWGGQLGIPVWPLSIAWMTILSAVAAWAFYRVVLLLTSDRPVALWCGAVFACHPAILRHAGFIMRDTPYIMACLLVALCLIHAIRERRWYMELLTGVFCALAILCRYEALELLVLLPVVSVFYFIHNRFSWRDILLFCVWSLIGFTGCTVLLLVLAGEPQVLPARFLAAVQVFLSRFVR